MPIELVKNTYAEWTRHSASHRGSRLMFGPEIEFDGSNATSAAQDVASDIIRILADGGFKAEYEGDGSLRNGLEVVVHPMTEEAIKMFGAAAFTSVFEKLANTGYNNNTSRAGGHLHVSRRALGKTLRERAFNVKRLCAWLYNNRLAFQQFSRRNESDMASWHRPYRDGVDASTLDPINDPIMFDNCVRPMEYDKFTAVNLKHGATIEIRTFGAYLNYQNFIARVELMRMIIKALTGWSSQVLEKHTLGTLVEANRKNAPAAYAEYHSTKNGRMVNGVWVKYSIR